MVNCALTPETRGLLGVRELGLMKPSAMIVNTARGPIIQEQALIEALTSGKIRGAALDVFEKEPLAADSPLMKLDMGRMDFEGALAVARGEAPLHVVNRDVLDRPGFRAKLERYRAAWSQRTA